MDTFRQQLNHANLAVLKFASWLWGKPRWAALMVGIANEIQELENAACDVINSQRLPNAVGPRLRMLARIVGQPYSGLSEADLRMMVGARIAINRSEGRWSDFVRVLSLLGQTYRMRSDYPAGLRIELLSNPASPDLVAGALQETAAGGVNVISISGVTNDGFAFDDDASADVTGDWSDDADLTAGVAWTFVV